MKIEIRDADYGDPVHRAGIVEVLDSYAADPIGAGRPLAPEVRERLVPGLEAHPTSVVLLAFAGDRAVGVAVCFGGFSTFVARPLLNIHDLAVLPEAQGRGVGRALLAAVEDRARGRGCCRITLEVKEENRRARGLYDRFGFSPVAGAEGQTFFLHKPLAP